MSREHNVTPLNSELKSHSLLSELEKTCKGTSTSKQQKLKKKQEKKRQRPIRSSKDLQSITEPSKTLGELVHLFINLMQVSEKMGFKKKDKTYWGCDELESEFVESKCEIEMLKRNNQMILEEVMRQEKVIKVSETPDSSFFF